MTEKAVSLLSSNGYREVLSQHRPSAAAGEHVAGIQGTALPAIRPRGIQEEIPASGGGVVPRAAVHTRHSAGLAALGHTGARHAGPLWMQIKRMFNVPMLVFMDDVLIFARSREQLTDIYVYLENSLGIDYRLRMNLGKTQTGRFATDRVDFCGWEFCGGYARISEKKKKPFIDRLYTLSGPS